MLHKHFDTNKISRRARQTVSVILLIVFSLATASCDSDDNDDFPVFPLNRPNAIVTVKPTANGSSFFMQLDDSTHITASNMQAAPYGNKEVRALVNYRLLTQPTNKRDFEVYVNWIDSVLTKPMAESLGSDDANSSMYRLDPVELLRDWTVCEDGYLTIHFRTQWTAYGSPHIVNLVATSPDNPFDLTFYHNAQGVKGGYWGDGIVAFRLDRLPDTKGKTVNMTLHWLSYSGKRSVTFRYSTRKGADKIEGLSFAQRGLFEKTIR